MAETNSGNGTNSRPARESIIGYFKRQPTETALFITRLITIFCSLYYVLPIGTPYAQQTAYSRAFFAAAATNALRLHQRVGGVQFSREFLIRIQGEDPCHYLFYSLLFADLTPLTLALWPIFLFALMHVTSFMEKLCVATGTEQTFVAKKLHEFNASYTLTLLSVIACSEIFMMPLILVLVLLGRWFILLPLVYYIFLISRYTSRRNPTSRTVYRQLRLYVEDLINNQHCPQIIRTIINAVIRLLCRLCPYGA